MSVRGFVFVGASFILCLPSRARADDAGSCAEMYTRVQTLRGSHKLVEARAELRVCAQSSCKDFIVKDCVQWAAEVEPSVPSVVPIAVDAAGNDIAGVKVSIDGVPLADAGEGRSAEIDPGAHTFTFEAPDGTQADKVVVVAEGERGKRVQITLESPARPLPEPPPAPPASPSPPPHGTDPFANPWKVAGLAGFGVGVLSVGIGAAFGGVAIHRKNAAACDASSCPSLHAFEEYNSAQNAGTASTVFFVVGGLLAAGGVATWFLAPHSIQVSPSVGANQASLQLRGRW